MTNGKILWLPAYFIYNLHKNTILYVTLHSRKVTNEEPKQLETTRVTVIKLPLFSGDVSLVRW